MHRNRDKSSIPFIELAPVVKNLPENAKMLFLASDNKLETYFLIYELLLENGEVKKYYYTGSADNLSEGQISTPHSRNGKTFVNCFYNHRSLEFCVSNPKQSSIHGHPVATHFPL